MRLYVCWLLIKPRFLWLAITGICIGVAIPCYWCSEKAIRLSGLFLQLCGIITVVWGIISTRQFFGLLPVREIFYSWWLEAPFRQLPVIYGSCSATLSSSVKGHGYTTYPLDHSAPVDERIRSLEHNISMLHECVSSLYSDILRKQAELNVRDFEHRTRLEEVHSKITTDLQSFGTSGLHISAIGAAWLFIGAIMGTASQELAVLFR